MTKRIAEKIYLYTLDPDGSRAYSLDTIVRMCKRTTKAWRRNKTSFFSK